MKGTKSCNSKILGEAGKQEILQNVPKILDLESSSEQTFSENCRWVPLKHEIMISQGCVVSLKVVCMETIGFRIRRDRERPHRT